ncbi:hypothetical protein Ae201684_003417 [Aphanomyces euteiches]|uniref:Uncharacterized protein n=1 Tax=Aphanomyces euteiches TaxID=100861 RepID=A0A6G0XLH7_9STRA|nr:hypothetical protein Ae201684_003417 [Aphanomyces euteiches]
MLGDEKFWRQGGEKNYGPATSCYFSASEIVHRYSRELKSVVRLGPVGSKAFYNLTKCLQCPAMMIAAMLSASSVNASRFAALAVKSRQQSHHHSKLLSSHQFSQWLQAIILKIQPGVLNSCQSLSHHSTILKPPIQHKIMMQRRLQPIQKSLEAHLCHQRFNNCRPSVPSNSTSFLKSPPSLDFHPCLTILAPRFA